MNQRPPDAMELHEIGRLVLSAGIGPRWRLDKLAAHSPDGEAFIEVVDQRNGARVNLTLWSERGASTGGAREVAEDFVRELERAGFTIVRSTP